jgi:hypothetical protein
MKLSAENKYITCRHLQAKLGSEDDAAIQGAGRHADAVVQCSYILFAMCRCQATQAGATHSLSSLRYDNCEERSGGENHASVHSCTAYNTAPFHGMPEDAKTVVASPGLTPPSRPTCWRPGSLVGRRNPGPSARWGYPQDRQEPGSQTHAPVSRSIPDNTSTSTATTTSRDALPAATTSGAC